MLHYQSESYFQETPSVYFNNIIQHNVSPITVEQLDSSSLEHFKHQIELAYTDETSAVIRRLLYFIPYIIQNIDWKEYAQPLEAWHLRYYYQRERFIEKTGLDWPRFLEHEPMQRALSALNLSAEPVFEFILFLKYYYSLRSELRYSCLEQFDMLMCKLNDDASLPVCMDVSIGGRHYKINNSDF